MFIAVGPLTSTVAPVADLRPGALSRMAWTRSVVAASLGPVAGIAVTRAVSPAWLKAAGVTATTPGRPFTASATCWAAPFGSGTPLVSTSRVSGPLKPGPKPSERWS